MSGLRSSFRIRSSLTVRSASTAVGSNPVPAIANGSTSTFSSSVAASSARHAPTVAIANFVYPIACTPATPGSRGRSSFSASAPVRPRKIPGGASDSTLFLIVAMPSCRQTRERFDLNCGGTHSTHTPGRPDASQGQHTNGKPLS